LKYVNKDTNALAQLRPEHLSNLHEVELLYDRDRFYLLLNKPIEQGVNVIPYVMNGMRSVRLHGVIAALDREKSTMEWVNPVENQWVLLDQFQDLPIIICTAHYTRFNPNNGLERQEAKVEAFDKKTGRLVIHPDRQKVTPNGQFYGMTTDAQTGKVELLRYDIKVRFIPENSTAGGAATKPAPGAAKEPTALPSRPLRVQVQIMPAPLVPAAPQPVPAQPAQKPMKE
jgi:hypothetical protein